MVSMGNVLTIAAQFIPKGRTARLDKDEVITRVGSTWRLTANGKEA